MSGSASPAGGIAGILFDFEGTLVDFQWRLAPAEAELRAAFRALGLQGPEFDGGSYSAMWNAAAGQGTPGIQALRRTVGPIYDRWDADALTRWAPRPGAADLLRQLVRRGIRCSLVSNIGRAALDAALVRFGLATWLDPVLSRDDVIRMKPDGEGIGRVLAAWELPARRTLFVGDSRADVLAARAAGTRVAIIHGGECSPDAFANLMPDGFVDELAALAGFVPIAP